MRTRNRDHRRFDTADVDPPVARPRLSPAAPPSESADAPPFNVRLRRTTRTTLRRARIRTALLPPLHCAPPSEISKSPPLRWWPIDAMTKI